VGLFVEGDDANRKSHAPKHSRSARGVVVNRVEFATHRVEQAFRPAVKFRFRRILVEWPLLRFVFSWITASRKNLFKAAASGAGRCVSAFWQPPSLRAPRRVEGGAPVRLWSCS